MAGCEPGLRVVGEAGAVGEVGFRGAPVAAFDRDEDVGDVGPDRQLGAGA